MPEFSRNKKTATKKELRNKIIEWNNQHPLDFWWRKKYNIPFGSIQHKEITFAEQAVDFLEDEMMKEHMKSFEKEESEVEESLLNGGKKIVKMSAEEIDREFDNLDLSQYSDKNIDSDINSEE